MGGILQQKVIETAVGYITPSTIMTVGFVIVIISLTTGLIIGWKVRGLVHKGSRIVRKGKC